MNNFLIEKKIVYFRMKLRFLHVNKTPCYTKQYVQQGKHPPLNIQNFLNYTCVLVYIQNIVSMLS